MVKGTSRQVIVVHAPEEKLFEQAIFILKDGAVGEEGISDEKLLKEARSYLELPRRHRSEWLTCGPVWAVAGAGATGLMWLMTILM